MDQSIPQPRLCVSTTGQGRREQNGVVRSLLGCVRRLLDEADDLKLLRCEGFSLTRMVIRTSSAENGVLKG